MSSYPTDRKNCGYSIRYIRWLMHSGTSSEIGPDAFALLVAVVMTEDEIHYQRAPNFYNEQLANRCGISTNSKHALIRARRIAIDAGLLWYEPGAKRRPGRYFVIGFSSHSVPNQHRMCTESEPNVNPSIPIPIPNKKNASLDFSDEDIQTAKWMFSLIQKLHPSHKTPSFEKWASSIRLMREQDKLTDSEIRRLFAAANSDSFWQKNILGPDKLRKQWDKLVIALKATSPKKSEEYPDLTQRKRSC